MKNSVRFLLIAAIVLSIFLTAAGQIVIILWALLLAWNNEKG
jgi:hypothetical protein